MRLTPTAACEVNANTEKFDVSREKALLKQWGDMNIVHQTTLTEKQWINGNIIKD